RLAATFLPHGLVLRRLRHRPGTAGLGRDAALRPADPGALCVVVRGTRPSGARNARYRDSGLCRRLNPSRGRVESAIDRRRPDLATAGAGPGPGAIDSGRGPPGDLGPAPYAMG